MRNGAGVESNVTKEGEGVEHGGRDGRGLAGELFRELQGIGDGLAAIVVVGDDVDDLDGADGSADLLDPGGQLGVGVEVVVFLVAAGLLPGPSHVGTRLAMLPMEPFSRLFRHPPVRRQERPRPPRTRERRPWRRVVGLQ